MDYNINEDQKLIKDSAHSFLANEFDSMFVREMEKDDMGFTPELWNKMSELGWMGVIFPEEYGGIEGSFLDLVILMMEMGYACLPGPFFSTVVLGAVAIMNAGNEEQKQALLPEIIEGKTFITLALNEENSVYSPNYISVKAEKNGDSFIINGTKLFVPDAHVADHIICVTRTKESENREDGITLFLLNSKTEGIEITPLTTFAGDKQSEIIFNNVKVSKDNILGELDNGWPVVKKVIQLAAVAKCAEMVGGGQRALELTLGNANEREQFGQKIGSFQAVQHHCANIKIYLETSRWMTYMSASKITLDLSCDKEISMAKAWVSDSCRSLQALAHQATGGIGFMEEHDLQLYFRRIKAGGVYFGDSDYHREIIAQELGL